MENQYKTCVDSLDLTTLNNFSYFIQDNYLIILYLYILELQSVIKNVDCALIIMTKDY